MNRFIWSVCSDIRTAVEVDKSKMFPADIAPHRSDHHGLAVAPTHALLLIK